MSETTLTAPAGPLDELYQKLLPFKGKELDLAKELSEGRIKEFLGEFGEAGAFTLAEATIALKDGVLTVSGEFAGTPMGAMATSLSFTLAADEKTLQAELRLTGDFNWGWSQAPWLSLNGPLLGLQLSDSEVVPPVGTVGAEIGTGKPAASLAVQVPGTEGTWLFTGTFPPEANLSQLFQLLGGVNLANTLPSPLSELTKLSIRSVALAYEPEEETVSYVAAELGTTVDWPLLPGGSLKVTSIVVDATVYDPAKAQSLAWTVTGTAEIGGGTVSVVVSYPEPRLRTSLDPDTKIDLSTFVTELVGHPVDLKASIVGFELERQLEEPGSYSLSAALDADWSIPVGSQAKLTITNLAFEIAGGEGSRTANLAGVVVIGAKKTVTLTLTAAYEEKPGWVFSAKETAGVIPLVELADHYLPAGWAPDPDGAKLDIKDLAVSVTPRTGAYSISGKVAGSWAVLGGFDLKASASVAYDGKDYKGKLEATLEEAFGVKHLGLHVAYSFDPKQKVYEIEWQGLTGTYKKPSDESKDSELEIKVEGWTLGRLVKELVSLATGARFSLAAPWDLLDDVSLDCTLLFTLPPKESGRKGTISFTYPLSLDIGIAAVSGITITYDEATKKVKVKLAGRFPWQEEKASEPLEWDAADPASTPAPPGAGSKYLELRTLGLGQHVALAQVSQSMTVKEIVDAVGKLATPDGDKLPTEEPGVTYSQQNSWLIAADLGILKLDEAPKEGSPYFLDAALIFNDPDLYGLHIELEGEPAKIFAGLQLDISYRKVSDTIGVYQGELQLPSKMRQFDVGAFSFTLPIIALAVYTNGDFQLDIGFPWNNDFSRSFTVQGIAPPGIPVIGAGGFYFGKLSAATAGSNVPATTKGDFNPVIVFGIGLQVGAGKTFEKGPLKAGLTITMLAVVQGVVARWHPNQALPDGKPSDQLEGPYYFKLQGTAGLALHMYGSVDFAVVKASVEVDLAVTLQLSYESYRPIPIEVSASVEVSASLSIDLGLFSITLHFHFSTTISTSFTVGSRSVAPWDDGAALEAPAPTLAERRLRMLGARSERLLAAAGETAIALTWDNLEKAATPLALTAYATPSFTVVGDDASKPGQQTAACVLLLWIESVSPEAEPAETGADTSFEALAKQVLRWTVAAAQPPGPIGAAKVDDLVVSDETLEQILAALADPADVLPISPGDADTFLQRNAVITVSAPRQGKANATYLPMPPQVELNAEALGIKSYSFEKFNSYDEKYIRYLRTYFSDLDVQVGEESSPPTAAAAGDGDLSLSVASIVYADYFTMVARHMVEAAREGLRDLKLPVPSGESVEATVAAINKAGDLASLGPAHLYTVAHLFEANADQPLKAGLPLRVAHVTAKGETLESITQPLAGAFAVKDLATENKDRAGLLLAGTAVAFPGKPPHTVAATDSLTSIAAELGIGVAELAATPALATMALTPEVPLLLPLTHQTKADETLGGIASSFGVPASSLGDPVTGNGALVDLFAAGEEPQHRYLDVPHLPQYRLRDLIEEAQRSAAIQRLSGMLARYFLHGVRLPKETGGSAEAGLFALTGQQLPLPGNASEAFDVSLSCPDTVEWLKLS